MNPDKVEDFNRYCKNMRQTFYYKIKFNYAFIWITQGERYRLIRLYLYKEITCTLYQLTYDGVFLNNNSRKFNRCVVSVLAVVQHAGNTVDHTLIVASQTGIFLLRSRINLSWKFSYLLYIDLCRRIFGLKSIKYTQFNCYELSFLIYKINEMWEILFTKQNKTNWG